MTLLLPEFDEHTRQRPMLHLQQPTRAPPKSILKPQRRPSIAPLRPLARAITDIFPLELFRIIIDTLQHDRRTLASCSLVCRAWVPLCREHFNPRMTVHPGNAVQFLDILSSSPHVSIASTIRHLTIHKQQNIVDHFFIVDTTPANTPTLAHTQTPNPPPPPPFQLSNILAKASFFPFITKLTLQKGYGQGSALASHLGDFHHLEELDMRSFEFISFGDLTAVLSAQPNLLGLSLTDIAWGEGGGGRTSSHGPSSSPLTEHQNPRCVLPNLHRLELFMEKQAELFNWILARPDIPAVEYVALGGITEVEDAIAVGRFLRGLGPVLKHLRLYSPTRISQVNLVHNTGLQSLKISHLHIGQNKRKDKHDRINSAGDEVCTILSQLCSPHITKISLQLLFNEPECFAFIDWSQVARTLSLPRYKNLQAIDLRIPNLKKWMATTIIRSLPKITNSRILSVANG